MSRIPLVDLSAQNSPLSGPLQEAFARVVAQGDFILGDEVERFEQDFASYCGARAAVGVDSGTSAIELALRAYGCGPGDEVITTPNTFIATALAISLTGAKPVFVDVEPDTHLIDPSLVEAAITERTKALVPVHLYGQAADMDPLMELARNRGLRVIEDAAQAHGATYRERRVGAIGDAAAFSFYPAKNLGGFGDGGAVVTDDEECIKRLQLLRNYGQAEKNEHEIVGFNRRLDTLQAAVLRVKLPYLDRWNEARRERARLYDECLGQADVATPVEANDRQHVWHLYVIRVAGRDRLRASLTERGIAAGLHYPRPIHLQPAYEHLGLPRGSFPVAEQLADELLSLPMYPELPTESVQEVSDVVVAHHRTASRPAA